MNFLQPVMKLVEKQQNGSKVRKRYDEARTPYKRVLASQEVAEEDEERLREVYQTLNPELSDAGSMRISGRCGGCVSTIPYEATLPPSVTVTFEATRHSPCLT